MPRSYPARPCLARACQGAGKTVTGFKLSGDQVLYLLFLATFFLAAFFLAGAFLLTAFFLAAFFLAGAFLLAAFFLATFFLATFFLAAFLRAGALFLAAFFLAGAFLLAAFLRAGARFLAAFFLAGARFLAAALFFARFFTAIVDFLVVVILPLRVFVGRESRAARRSSPTLSPFLRESFNRKFLVFRGNRTDICLCAFSFGLYFSSLKESTASRTASLIVSASF